VCGPFRELLNLMRGPVPWPTGRFFLVEDSKFLRSATERTMVRAG